MQVVLKRETKQFLTSQGGIITALVIDGRLDAEFVKSCGCCGPPPSPDYAVDVIHAGDGKQPPKDFVQVSSIVPVFVAKQLHDAIDVARLNVVLFYLETAGEAEGSGYLVAKFI